MISATIVGDRDLIARIGEMPRTVHDELAREVKRLGFKLEALVKTQYLTGQVLKVRTGRLKSSITQGAAESRSRFSDTGTEVAYFVGTNVKYGRTWEYGADVPAYTVRPKNARALHFNVGGRDVFAMKAEIPAHHIAARPFLAPALAQMKQEIIDGMQAALKRGMEKALKQ